MDFDQTEIVNAINEAFQSKKIDFSFSMTPDAMTVAVTVPYSNRFLLSVAQLATQALLGFPTYGSGSSAEGDEVGRMANINTLLGDEYRAKFPFLFNVGNVIQSTEPVHCFDDEENDVVIPAGEPFVLANWDDDFFYINDGLWSVPLKESLKFKIVQDDILNIEVEANPNYVAPKTEESVSTEESLFDKVETGMMVELLSEMGRYNPTTQFKILRKSNVKRYVKIQEDFPEGGIPQDDGEPFQVYEDDLGKVFKLVVSAF